MKAPSFRIPESARGLDKIAEGLMHAAECIDFCSKSALIYIGGESNSFTLRLQSVQGPDSGDADIVLARKLLTVLKEAGLSVSARMPGQEGFLKPIKALGN